jgi:valyl-tRNA synthetase
MDKLPDKYKPADFESDIYNFWLEKGYFHSEISSEKKPYSIVIPPPNITGYLHVGHALNNSLQDIMIRYARMKGFAACWFPGTDHAGIATQNVVEKELGKSGVTRFMLGREKFVEKVWEWRGQYGSRIISQLKSLGCSCDWDRLRFTFDDDYVKSVNHEFVTLYNAGLIYRGNYIVNWCPRCLTAVSDIEVEHKEKKGNLWDIRYPLIVEETGLPSKTEFITVSTTRPETMLGDTAVAVNPTDKRYKKYLGRNVFLPLTGRFIPVIEDNYVDKAFGTGAVKVTPAHDPNDFEMGQRHGLDKINIMTDDALMNENAGIYKGLERYTAREKVLEDLESQGFLASRKEHTSSLGICSRCDTVVEPRISLQWFVSMKTLAEPAILAVKDGRVKFVPKKWEKLYFNWMENIRDWCISRQLWWGHRIPVWYCAKCNEMIVTELTPQACKCGSTDLRQDEDVLDTWFSSNLWPFAMMKWPQKTAELDYFFPTNVLITGHDIIFFWVARMIMMSLYFMKEVPFKEVFINPLVNDISGQKMSKSKGNVIDPMTIIDKNGADVLRFTLASLTTPGKNMLLGEDKIEGSRNFANKLWNASKFVIANIQGADVINMDPNNLALNHWDKWILSKLAKTIKSLERYLEKYSISFACKCLTDFFWNDYCDWYIESAKSRIYEKKYSDDKSRISVVSVPDDTTVKSGDHQTTITGPGNSGTGSPGTESVGSIMEPGNNSPGAELGGNITGPGSNSMAGPGTGSRVGEPGDSGKTKDRQAAIFVLWYVLERYLKILHPFMPFVTEKIWQSIPHEGESIIVSEFPGLKSRILDKTDNSIENELLKIFNVISEIRKIRSELKINPASRISVYINPADTLFAKILQSNSGYIKDLAKLSEMIIGRPVDNKGFIKTLRDENEIFVYILDAVDIELEIKRIINEIRKVMQEKDKSSAKIENPQFLDKAPKDIIKKEKLKLGQALKIIQSLEEQLRLLQSIK